MENKAKRGWRINGPLVHELRAREGLDLKALATRVDVSINTLSGWLNGKSAYLRNIAALAEALGENCPDRLILNEDKTTEFVGERVEMLALPQVVSNDFAGQVRAIAEEIQARVLSIETIGSMALIEVTRDDAGKLIGAILSNPQVSRVLKGINVPDLDSQGNMQFWVQFLPSD